MSVSARLDVPEEASREGSPGARQQPGYVPIPECAVGFPKPSGKYGVAAACVHTAAELADMLPGRYLPMRWRLSSGTRSNVSNGGLRLNQHHRHQQCKGRSHR